MAVTIENTFNELEGLQKPLVVTASSTNTSEEKFRYVMTVDVNGTEVIKVKQQANQNDYVHFDLYQILKDYLKETNIVSSTPIHKILTAVAAEDSAMFVELNIYEEYASSATTDPTEYPATGDTAEFIVLDTTFQFSDGVTPTITGVYEYNDDSTELSWMSKQPTTLTTRIGEYSTSCIIVSDLKGSTYPVTNADILFNVRYFESDGTLIANYDIPRTALALNPFRTILNQATANVLYQIFPTGYQNLEDQTFSLPLRPSNQSTTPAYYTIQIFDDNYLPDGYKTKIYRFNIADCSKYTPVQLAWINSLGAWDYYTFELASIETLNIQRETITTNYGNWNTAANFSYGQYERGEMVTKIEANKEYTINSDWLDDEYFIWLQELLMSKEVYYCNSDGVFNPIILTDNSYEIKSQLNKKLNSLTLKFKLAHKIR